MRTKSHAQLGTLTSESFSERTASSAKLLVGTCRLKCGDGVIDELAALRMSKKFMDRTRSKTTFATMTFETMNANKRSKV